MALETRRRPRKDEETVPPQPDVDPAPHEGRRWYVIHTYSGYENKVKADL
jgi:hypothetical protein